MAVTIGTHDGCFHADETIACAMLKQLPKYRDAEIIRTRDPSILAQCSIVLDVGGTYDAEKNRFDHHQRGFNITLKDIKPESKWDIKLSSAGLIYAHFGERIVASILKLSESDPVVTKVNTKLYGCFFAEIDAIDNGISITDHETRYNINTSLSDRIKRMNLQWNDANADQKAQFNAAVAIVEKEFVSMVHHYAKHWYPARLIVKTALEKRYNYCPTGCVVVFDEMSCPWGSHMHELEREELNNSSSHGGRSDAFDTSTPATYLGRPLFVISKRSNESFDVKTVSVSEESGFTSRLPFPEQWRGLRDEELCKAANIPGCIFVHATGFLGINKTLDGAMEMAHGAMKEAGLLPRNLAV